MEKERNKDTLFEEERIKETFSEEGSKETLLE